MKWTRIRTVTLSKLYIIIKSDLSRRKSKKKCETDANFESSILIKMERFYLKNGNRLV